MSSDASKHPFLPYGRQWVDDDDIEAVASVLRSDLITTGPAIEAFESALAAAAGAEYAVAVNSGTSALHAMYFSAGLGSGDEIVTSPLTFAATANAAIYLGARVQFADVEADTGNLDVAAAADAINNRTRFIVPVDFAGHPAEYVKLNAVAQSMGVGLLADSAHSLGATFRGQPVATMVDALELSFHPVKPVTTAEGGAVLTNSPDIAARARMFRTHGITRDPGHLTDPDPGEWYYEMHHLGYNYRMTDIQAALGLSQLKKLEQFINRRRDIARQYSLAFEALNGVILPKQRKHAKSAWHLYVIRVGDKLHRRPLFDRLRQLGLGVQVHYLPVYWHPFYLELGYRKGQCPVAEDFYERAISLPIFPKMSEDDVASVIERVHQAVAEVIGS